VSGLAEKLEVQSVQMKLTRKSRTWQFALEVTEKDATEEKPDEPAGKHSGLGDKKELAAKLTKQIDAFDHAHSDASKKDEAAKALAELLEIASPPDLPEKPNVAAISNRAEKAKVLKDYRAEMKKYEPAAKEIHDKAKDKLDALKGEIEDAEREAKNTQADRQRQAQSKQDRWKRVAKISARLYRLVDGTIRADDLTVGEP
jgi:ribosomal protein S10